MTSRIGSPLQALKFATLLLSHQDAGEFIADWDNSDSASIFDYAYYLPSHPRGLSFVEFCAANPDTQDPALLERVAIKLRDRAAAFRDPVHYYVRDAAWDLYMQQHPERDDIDREDDEFAAVDWELESWKLLAAAAIEGLTESSPGTTAKEDT